MRTSSKLISLASGLLLLCGCYNYPAAPKATYGNSFSHREKDKNDDLFKGMKSLTLADAQRIALENNPDYLSAAFSINAARSKYYQALGAYSPVITADFSMKNTHSWATHQVNAADYGQPGEHRRTDSFTTSTGVSANLLLFDGLAREFNWLAAKHNVNYRKHLEADACRLLMRSVAYAYNEVLLAIENRRIADEDRKFQQVSLKDTQYKFDAGAVPLSDVLNFQILMNNADVSMIAADYQYETAVYALAVLMGYPDGTLPADLSFDGDFKSIYENMPSVEVYLDAALANRPDLKGYRDQLEVAKYQMYATYSAYSPQASAFANFGYNTNLSRYHDYEYPRSAHDYANTPSFSYGLSASWTVFNGLVRYNKVREYQAYLAVADYSVATQWFAVVREVRTAYANYIQNVKKNKLYLKTRDLSKKQRDLVDDEYRAGNAELTRLNEAQRDLVQAETNLASSYINIQNARAQLDAAVGVNTAEYYAKQSGKAGAAAPGLENAKGPHAQKAREKKTQPAGTVKLEKAVAPDQKAAADKAEAEKIAAAKTEPAKKTEPVKKAAPAKKKAAPAKKAEPVKTEAVKAEAVKAEAVKAEPEVVVPEKKAVPEIPATATEPAKK